MVTDHKPKNLLPLSPQMRKILFPIASLYWIALKIRHKLYDWNILPSKQFPMPIICIGNLRFGGTGKTPHTEYLIELLKGSYCTATLSRGYGRKTKGFVLADTTASCETLGDEPLLYFKKHHGIQVGVDEDRVDGVQHLLQQPTPPEVILLDDAFQHRKIRAGLNLLLTEYEQLYIDDHLVPAGNLRDIKSAARRADCIVVSKSPKDLDARGSQAIRERLSIAAQQQVFFSYLEYEDLQPLNALANITSANKSDSVLVFCGIANPAPLIEHLQKHHAKVELLRFADHHNYSEHDIQNILKRFDDMSGERKIIVTTEKDAMRLTKNTYLCQLESVPLFTAPIRVRFHEEEKFNEAIEQYVQQSLNHS